MHKNKPACSFRWTWGLPVTLFVWKSVPDLRDKRSCETMLVVLWLFSLTTSIAIMRVFSMLSEFARTLRCFDHCQLSASPPNRISPCQDNRTHLAPLQIWGDIFESVPCTQFPETHNKCYQSDSKDEVQPYPIRYMITRMRRLKVHEWGAKEGLEIRLIFWCFEKTTLRTYCNKSWWQKE